MSSGFSLLEEAWGSDATPSRQRSRRRRKFGARAAPLCDSVGCAKQGQTGFTDTFQASLAPFEPIYVNDDDDASDARAQDRRSRDDDQFDTEPSAADAAVTPCPPCPPAQQIIRYERLPAAPTTDDRHDAFLYVFSGVLLIFILEQFLRMGIAIGQASRFRM